jgi:hypothetical protein
MATEKQVSYIKKLIDERRPENMPWWNKPITGLDEGDRKRGQRYADSNKRQWIYGVFGVNPFDAEDLGINDTAEAIRLYKSLIVYLDGLTLGALTTSEASALISDLKNFSFGRGKLDLVR